MLTADPGQPRAQQGPYQQLKLTPPELRRDTKAVVYKQPVSEISRGQAKQRKTPITRKRMDMRGTCKSILSALKLPQALSSASAPALPKLSTPPMLLTQLWHGKSPLVHLRLSRAQTASGTQNQWQTAPDRCSDAESVWHLCSTGNPCRSSARNAGIAKATCCTKINFTFKTCYYCSPFFFLMKVILVRNMDPNQIQITQTPKYPQRPGP